MSFPVIDNKIYIACDIFLFDNYILEPFVSVVNGLRNFISQVNSAVTA